MDSILISIKQGGQIKKSEPRKKYMISGNHCCIDLNVLDITYKGLRQKIKYYRMMWQYLLARSYRPFKKEISFENKTSYLLRVIGKITSTIGKRKKLSKIITKYDNISKKGIEKYGQLQCTNATPHDASVIICKKWFESTTMVQIRDTSFPAPSGYDELLTLFYGDYMCLPPNEKRHPYHYILRYEEPSVDAEE